MDQIDSQLEDQDVKVSNEIALSEQNSKSNQASE